MINSPKIFIQNMAKLANYENHLDERAYAIGRQTFPIGFKAAFVSFVWHTALSGTAGAAFRGKSFSR
jgi:hypothetical protein